MEQLFELTGRPVFRGDKLHIAPPYHRQAGAIATVERYYGDDVQLRTDNGAVPTVPVTAVSWEPHPDTTDMEKMKRVGITRVTHRDLMVWRAAIESMTPNVKVRGDAPPYGAASLSTAGLAGTEDV